MTTFVAFCENPKCGAIFQAPGLIGGDGAATIHLSDTRYGPCPSCGSMGLIPDGVYSYAKNVVQLLRGPQESVSALRKVEALLRAPTANTLTVSELVSEIRALSPRIADAVTQAPRATVLQQWIQIALAFVTLAILVQTTYFKKSDKELELEFAERLIQQSRQAKQGEQIRQEPHRRTKPKVGRNESCTCGSGKKFKKCCGVGA